MLRLAPILIAVAVGLVMYLFSANRLKRDLDRKSSRLSDPILNALTARMAQELGVKEVPVYVYEIEPVNGLAAPDGRVFITRGFLRKYQSGAVSAAELSSVIAHELGHVALGHARRRMIDFSAQNAIRVVLTMVIGRLVPVVGPWIAQGLVTLLTATLSRQDEFEADAYAAALLTKAGIGVAPQIALFEKLDRMTGMGGQGGPVWLSSHPQTEKRIAALRRLEAGWTTAREG
ncbi:M48 family metallopeptidase [Oceanomicrobium pacificus]|uniref:M48 family metalloprotease n=1 Tax=Oceanomicrobium pacificus TaxID=2692916 RepID=A0A6B0TVA0_9RHOB|nr:M48 family metallopeptidase [Oceanomicrobium pacificus]MXU65478.1 M48 family metalloprotease [Oceanomicrobium pacificus]